MSASFGRFGSPSSGEKYGEVNEIQIEGRVAWNFERDKFTFMPPRSINPKKIPIYERFVVISARQGFFVLRSNAGGDKKSMVQDQFNAVLASFRPLVD